MGKTTARLFDDFVYRKRKEADCARREFSQRFVNYSGAMFLVPRDQKTLTHTTVRSWFLTVSSILQVAPCHRNKNTLLEKGV